MKKTTLQTKKTLRAIRLDLKITQAEVAAGAGIDQAEVSRIEQRDDIKVSTLFRYLDAMEEIVQGIVLMQQLLHYQNQ